MPLCQRVDHGQLVNELLSTTRPIASWCNGGRRTLDTATVLVAVPSFFGGCVSFLVCRKGRLAAPIYMHAHRPLILCIRFDRGGPGFPRQMMILHAPSLFKLLCALLPLVSSFGGRSVLPSAYIDHHRHHHQSFCSKSLRHSTAAAIVHRPPSVHNF